jgi:hypothetical protein
VRILYSEYRSQYLTAVANPGTVVADVVANALSTELAVEQVTDTALLAMLSWNPALAATVSGGSSCRSAGGKRALPVKHHIIQGPQEHADQVQSGDEQTLVEEIHLPAQQGQPAPAWQPGSGTSKTKQRPSLVQIREELQRYGTANNPDVLMVNMRFLHDVLLVRFPTTSTLPANEQQPSWPLPPYSQHDEPMKDDSTADRYVQCWSLVTGTVTVTKP